MGARSAAWRVERAPDVRVEVDMGEPNFTKAAIPMRGPAWETYLREPLDLGGGLIVTASAGSMGNPHLVLFVDEDPERFHVAHIGAVLERDDRFPGGTNVEFAKVEEDEIVARVWERGSGETMACGSGGGGGGGRWRAGAGRARSRSRRPRPDSPGLARSCGSRGGSSRSRARTRAR